MRFGLARGLPGLANFLALAVFARVLGRAGYGAYALVIASIGLAYALLFQWLSLATLRFAGSSVTDRIVLLATIRRWFLRLALAVIVAVSLLTVVGVPWVSRGTLAVAGLLLLAHGWLEINLMLASADGAPMRYGGLAGARAIGTFVFGGLGAVLGFGYLGVLAGAGLGFGLPAIWAAAVHWRGLEARPDPVLDRTVLSYGVPLIGTYLLDFVISTSDRLLIGSLRDVSSAGAYSAAYDLAQQSMWALMMIVNLSAYPMMMAAAESRDGAALGRLGRRHLGLLLGVALPSAVGLAVLAPGISAVVFGAEFVAEASQVLPILAGAILLGGIKSYYFDLAFQATRSTRGQLVAAAVAGMINLALNLVLIPLWGGPGAAWSTLTAYAAGLAISVWLGGRRIALPIHGGDLGRMTAAAAVMGLGLWFTRERVGLATLVIQILGGAVGFAAMCWWLNPWGVRDSALGWLAARSSGRGAIG